MCALCILLPSFKTYVVRKVIHDKARVYKYIIHQMTTTPICFNSSCFVKKDIQLFLSSPYQLIFAECMLSFVWLEKWSKWDVVPLMPPGRPWIDKKQLWTRQSLYTETLGPDCITRGMHVVTVYYNKAAPKPINMRVTARRSWGESC